MHDSPSIGWRDPWVEEKAKFLSEGLDDKLKVVQRSISFGQHEAALNSLQELRRDYPESTRVLQTLAVVLRRTGNLDEAIELLEEALFDHPTQYTFYVELSNLLAEQGKLTSALDFL